MADMTLVTHKIQILAHVQRETHSSLILGSGVDGVSGREFMMLAGGARESDGARASQSSVSTFIVLIFFFLLSSFSFLFGRVKSQSADGERIP